MVSIFKGDEGGTIGQGADGKSNGELYFLGIIDLVRDVLCVRVCVCMRVYVYVCLSPCTR